MLDPGELRPLRERAWEDALAGILGRPGTPPPAGGARRSSTASATRRCASLIGDLYDELRSAGQSRRRCPVPDVPTLEEAEFLPALAALDELLLAFGVAFTAAKRERHGLDYADLAVATRDLLVARPEIARGYAERLQRVLVDEFQDTNRLQVDLLAALGQEQMFLVGDRLQSIYAFRHADVGGFEREWRRHEAAGTARALATNFRSHPAILELINAALGPQQEDFAPLEPGREARRDRRPAGRGAADRRRRLARRAVGGSARWRRSGTACRTAPRSRCRPRRGSSRSARAACWTPAGRPGTS